jgi:hypothetical protein
VGCARLERPRRVIGHGRSTVAKRLEWEGLRPDRRRRRP